MGPLFTTLVHFSAGVVEDVCMCDFVCISSPGQRPTWDCSGPAAGSYKGFTWQASLHLLHTAPSEGALVKDSPGQQAIVLSIPALLDRILMGKSLFKTFLRGLS